jgi:hypothetical protein
MSIFRETFPAFVQNELKRRQDGMATRNPAFLHQLNSRSAWVRMTSGVDFEGSSALAKNYVLQGGTLFHSIDNNKDNFSQRMGIGNSSMAYSNRSINGEATSIKNRSGIRPMPGITNVAIQSKGAYGSLQEATVTFTCWDIKQLEELEILYMRPGYTVLLEFGWDFAKVKGALPSYDILNPIAPEGITLNDAFAQIYDLIEQSGGTYDALLGYVKNYNWSARDDGGYDCTTSIISLGEVLESLKCNWVPGETIAFNNSGKGILKIANNNGDQVTESYQKGIIPGLLQELWNSMRNKKSGTSQIVTDPNTGNYYYLYRLDIKEDKNNRGGLEKPLGPSSKEEIYITLGSFCDLLSTYVFPKGAKNQPLSEIVTYETDYKSDSYIKYSANNSTNSSETLFNSKKPINAYATSLKCIASPLALSTNLGVCYVRNDNWNNLKIQVPEDTPSTPSAAPVVKEDIKIALNNATFSSTKPGYGNIYPNNVYKRFTDKISKVPGVSLLNALSATPSTALLNPATAASFVTSLTRDTYYTYNGNLENDITTLTTDIVNAIKDIKIESKTTQINGDQGTYSVSFLKYTYIFENGKTISFTPNESNKSTLNLLSYFGGASSIYDSLFVYEYNKNGTATKDTSVLGLRNEDPFNVDNIPVKELPNPLKQWNKQGVLNLIQEKFSNIPLNDTLQKILNSQSPEVAKQIANAASNVSSRSALPFLENNNGDTKQLGYISNIYVNLNYLYEQAISKNTASNDNQNKNTISIRDYIQGIMRDVQNSLGNINTFDIQVDNRNAIGRIIDIAYTGSPKEQLFLLQMHNINSVVREYKFSSKIFPEMGSIIAISAQDATGIGKLGYDNATLVAWNEGIKDRLIPKKDFNSDIAIQDGEKPDSFLLPFLTKIYDYFQYINNQSIKDDLNYAYGGLDFAYRDFLSNLDRFDPQNRFKTIIPTELSITLDGIGGLIIGNIFKINQDIIPKGYKGITGERDIAYIVTRLGHQISGNDWVTELNAYPIVFENAKRNAVWKNWKNNQYPGATIITINGNPILNIPDSNFIPGSYSTANDNNPFNIVANNNTLDYRGVIGYKIASNSGLPFLVFDTEANGVRAGVLNLSNYFTNRKLNTVKDIINTYAPPGSAGQTTEATNNYIKFVTNYLKTNWNSEVTSTTTLTFRGSSETNNSNIKMFKTLVKGIVKQEGKLTAALSAAIDKFDIKNL